MKSKKFDMLQIFILLAYLAMLFSMMYLPFEVSPEGALNRGFKSVANILICIYILKAVMHPFGFESMSSISTDLFFVWCTQMLSIYLKIFTGKDGGTEVVLSGVIFPTVMLITLSILLIIDRKLYFTGKKIERNEGDVF